MKLLVVNVSNSGLLVQCTARLLPGTHVDVHLVTPTAVCLVRSRLVRAYVLELGADEMRHGDALAFEREVDIAALINWPAA